MIEGPKAKKVFGQHFLVDEQVLNSIIEEANIEKNDIILEIGPGKGVLTREMAKRAKKVIAVDVDPDMVEYSKNALSEFDNVDILLANISEVDLSEHIQKNGAQRIKVIANIPYYITTPIIEWLLKNVEHIEYALLLMQYEVAKKLTAKPATSDYSAITVKVNYCADVKLCFEVSQNSFVPPPKVNSAVVSFNFKEGIVKKEEMFNLIDDAFRLRRKNIRNSFKAGKIFASDMQKLDAVLGACNIESTKRAEELNLENYVEILKILES